MRISLHQLSVNENLSSSVVCQPLWLNDTPPPAVMANLPPPHCTQHFPHYWARGSSRANPIPLLIADGATGGRHQLRLFILPTPAHLFSPGVEGWATWLAGDMLRQPALPAHPLPCLPATPSKWVDVRLSHTLLPHHFTSSSFPLQSALFLGKRCQS
jgi:hypothetical protein